MVSGKGESPSRRGSSLLRYAEDVIARRRDPDDPRLMLDQLRFPQNEAPDAAELHRRARAKRERSDNAYLSELANRPDEPAPAPEPVYRAQAPVSQPAARTQPRTPSILEEFDRMDRALRLRKPDKGQPSFIEDKPSLTEDKEQDFEAEPRAQRQTPSGEWQPLINPRFILDAVYSFRKFIVTASVLGALAGVAVALSTPKLFYATAELSIDPRGRKVIDNGVTPEGFVSDLFAIVDSQVRVINSPVVLEQVVDKLDLHNDIEFNGALKVGWLESVLGIFSRRDAGSDTKIAAAEYLSDHVYVDRGAKTYVINITAASENPQLAAQIANTVVEVYVAEQKKQQSATVRDTTESLTQRLADLKSNLERSEQKVETFKAENDLVGANGRLIDDEAILRVNDQLTAARGQTITLNARAKSVRGITADSVLNGALPEEVNSSVLTALRSQYSTAKQKRDGLATKLGPRHPERILAESELESLRASIAAEIKRVSASMQTDLKRAVQTEQDLAARLAELKAGQGNAGSELVTLRQLQREADANRSVYEAFLLRARQTGEQINLNTSDIRVIVSARPPQNPAGTSRKLIVLSGLLGGLGLGLALAILKGVIDGLRARLQGGAGAPARPERPSPDPSPGGGMFRPKGAASIAETVGRVRSAASAASPVRAVLEPALPEQQTPAPALQPAAQQPAAAWSAPLPQAAPPPAVMWPAQQAVAMPPQPAPWQQPVYAHPPQFAPQPVHAQQWIMPAPYPAHMIPAGPMMYPAQPAPHQPAFVPQAIPAAAWPGMPQTMSPPQPVQVEMHAPVSRQAAHPFAHEAASAPWAAPARPAPHASPADPRLAEIQESIEEFRSALNDLASRRRA